MLQYKVPAGTEVKYRWDGNWQYLPNRTTQEVIFTAEDRTWAKQKEANSGGQHAKLGKRMVFKVPKVRHIDRISVLYSDIILSGD